MAQVTAEAPSSRPLRLFFSVGDLSADLHAANLIREIRKLRPDAILEGMGGERMRQAGCEILYPLTTMNVMWFRKVFANLHRVWGTQRDALRHFEAHRPDAVVTMDFPGYNLLLARRLRRRRIPVIYYISPQIWAWFLHRIRKIRRRITRVLCIFPFEEKLYRDAGIPVEYVGHPLYDHLDGVTLDAGFCKGLRTKPGQPLIGLLPGSRVQEVKRKLPVMARAAQAIRRELPDASFVVPCAGEEQLRVAEEILARYDLPVRAFEGKTYEVMKEADFCIATSGTVTLELMHFNAPMAVIYRINWASYLIARTFMRTKFIAMPNVLAGREVVFDRLLWRDSPEEIAGAALDVIRSPARRDEVRSALRELRQKFDHPGAAHQAAQAIVRFAEQYRGHVSDGGSQWPE